MVLVGQTSALCRNVDTLFNLSSGESAEAPQPAYFFVVIIGCNSVVVYILLAQQGQAQIDMLKLLQPSIPITLGL